MKLENKIHLYSCFLILTLFSFYINYWSGSIGVFPIDTFLHYDAGYKILNKEIPVRDFWIIHGLTIDYLQAIFFYFFGVNWQSYLAHASFFNMLVTLSCFIFFNSIGIRLIYSFLLAIFFSVLAYPVSGVPFIDHHSTFFSLISLFIFWFGIKKENYFYFITIPLLLALAFFSKPVPAAYITILIGISLIVFCIKEKNYKPIIKIFYGIIILFFLLFLFLKTQNINIKLFIDQIILFPLSIGSERSENILGAALNRIPNFKFIILSLILIIFYLLKSKNYSKISNKKFFLVSIFIFFSIIMIGHQLLTKNQNFIFFLIPLNMGIVFFLIPKNEKKELTISIYLILTFALVLKYHERFNIKKKFHDLNYVKLENSLPASKIDKSLEKLMWITREFKDPNDEFNLINSALSEINNSKKNQLIITNYNFMDSISAKKIYSITRTFDDVTLPSNKNKFYKNFKIFIKNKLKKNNIEEIIILLPNQFIESQFKDSLELYLPKGCYEIENIEQGLSKIDMSNIKC